MVESRNFNPPGPGVASAAVFFSAALWGLYWIPLRLLEGRGISGSWAIAILNVPAAFILVLVFCRQWQLHQGHIRHAVIIGALTGLGLALYASGLVYSSVIRATLLFYLTPVWATLIGLFWLGERASWQRWASILTGLGGLLLLVSGGDSLPLNFGDLFALFSGVFWAMGAAMIKRFDTVPLAGMTMFQFAVTAAGSVGLGYLAGIQNFPGTGPLVEVLPIAILISILLILPAVLILFWAQKFLFPGRVGLLMMSEVLTAVITASIFLPEERLSGVEWAGAFLIVSACLIEVFATPRKI